MRDGDAARADSARRSGMARIRLVGVDGGVDHTLAMTSFADRRVADLQTEDLCGYVLKSDSPSCGVAGVAVHGSGVSESQSVRSGTGLFAAELLARFQDLPIEEESSLRDAQRRDHFVERVCAYRRLRDLFDQRWTTQRSDRVSHGAQARADGRTRPQPIGRWAAWSRRRRPRHGIRQRQTTRGSSWRRWRSRQRRHVTSTSCSTSWVISDRTLDVEARAGLAAAIEQYRVGSRTARRTPLGRLRVRAREQDIPYLRGQLYLEPDPREILMRAGG